MPRGKTNRFSARGGQGGQGAGRFKDREDEDYTPEQLEFLLAVQSYKDRTGDMLAMPSNNEAVCMRSWAKVLEIATGLGWRREKKDA